MNGRILGAVLLVAIVGCTVTTIPGSGGPSTPSTPSTTSIRVAHAAPSERAFDVCVGGEVILENSRYGRITEYTASRAGAVTFRVIDAGGNCSNVIGDDITVDLLASRAYTMVVLDDVDPLTLSDDTSPVTSGRARIRVVNASPNSLALDAVSYTHLTLPTN